MTVVYYGKSDVLAEGTNANIGTTEADIISELDLGDLSYSQLSMYISFALGTHSAIDLRVYCQSQKNGNWHQLIKKDLSSGEIEDDFDRLIAATPARVVIDLPISAAMGLKVTGKGIGGAGGSATVRLMGRVN